MRARSIVMALIALCAATAGAQKPGRLGANLTALTSELARVAGLGPDRSGAIVANVLPKTPAAAAGLRPGDVIVAIDGRPVEGPHHATDLIGFHEIGETVSLSVMRNGRPLAISARLAEVADEELRRPVVEGEQVQAAIAILEARIAELEKRVARLESRR
jgi:S1-C subfamily serine protease